MARPGRPAPRCRRRDGPAPAASSVPQAPPLGGAGVLACATPPPPAPAAPPPRSPVAGPVLDNQAPDTGELAAVVGDQGEAPGPGLSGDQHVIGADRAALLGQLRPDLAGHPRILPIEVEDRQIGKEQPEGFKVEVNLPAAIGAVPEFVRHDRGDRERSRRRGLDPAQQRRGTTRDQRDHRVGIEKVAYHSKAWSTKGLVHVGPLLLPRLVPSFRQEVLAEPLRNGRAQGGPELLSARPRPQDHRLPLPGNLDLVDLEAELLRQPHRLRVAGPENLRDVSHGTLLYIR